MIKANEARKRAESYSAKPRKWNMFDTLQLKWIEIKIKFQSARGETDVSCGGLRTLVADRLEKDEYKVEPHRAADEIWVEIHWQNTKKQNVQ